METVREIQGPRVARDCNLPLFISGKYGSPYKLFVKRHDGPRIVQDKCNKDCTVIAEFSFEAGYGDERSFNFPVSFMCHVMRQEVSAILTAKKALEGLIQTLSVWLKENTYTVKLDEKYHFIIKEGNTDEKN